LMSFFFFQAEDGIRDFHVTGVQTCALPISFLVAFAVPSLKPFVMAAFQAFGFARSKSLCVPLFQSGFTAFLNSSLARLLPDSGEDRKSVVSGKRGGLRVGRVRTTGKVA